MSIRRSLVAVLTVSLAAFLCASCAESGADDWQPPTVVRVEGCKQAQAISPMYGIVFGSAIERTGQAAAPLAPVEDTTYVLLRPGELLGIEGSGPAFPYARADGTTLSFKVEDKGEEARMLLAGKTVAVGLGEKDEQGWAWLREAPAEDLAGVRSLVIFLSPAQGEAGQALSDAQRGALARLAKANPRVGLVLNDAAVLRTALEMFDPPWLSFGNLALSAEARALLAAEPNLHTLMMNVEADSDLGFLPRLSRLRTLFISEWQGQGKEAPPPTLPTIPSLRTLIAFGTEMKDLGPVGDQPNLEELALVMAGDLVDVGRLAEMPGLRTLSLQGCKELKDLSALSALKDLRWLALPPQTTQEQFARICTEHADLVVLHAVSSKEITDLAPLKRLHGLRVLSVCEVKAPLDPVADMKSLRLLGVGLTSPDKKEGDEEDTEQKPRDEEDKGPEPIEMAVVRIMKANPDLAVVEVSPMCLGSGWILVLAPMAAGAWWLARRRQRCRTAVRHG